jgi:hypothetical protein
MSHATPPHNPVRALRERDRGTHNVKRRRIAIRVLLVLASAAGLVAVGTSDPRLRAWCAIGAAIGLVAVAIAWLAGAGSSLSSSGRDPQDFQYPP